MSPLPETLEPGDILSVKWDERPMRVIQSDPIETFYDCKFEHVGWNMARARTSIFYRIVTRLFTTGAELIERRPFSRKEWNKFRPDLPMRLIQNAEVEWTDSLEALLALSGDEVLATERIVIIPFGPKGGSLKPVHLEASAEAASALSLADIVEVAHSSQSDHFPDVKGVGLYRSGLVGGIPSYYLGGANSRSG